MPWRIAAYALLLSAVVLAATEAQRNAQRAPREPKWPTILRPVGSARGIVTDAAEIARIAARVTHASLPWWRRMIAKRPEGW